MAMRAQISLQFDDEVLFDNLITPYKEQRALNGLIVRCLSAYFYDESIRNAIEGIENEESGESEYARSAQDIFNEMRSALMMQGIYTDELQNTVQDGIDDTNDILRNVNNAMHESGFAESTKSEYGAGVPKVNLGIVEKLHGDTSPAGAMQDTGTNALLAKVIEAVKIMASSMGNAQALAVLETSSEPVPQVEHKVSVENTSKIDESQVDKHNHEEKSVIAEQVHEQETNVVSHVIPEPRVSIVAPPPKIDTENKAEKSEAGSAVDAMRGLLDGLVI